MSLREPKDGQIIPGSQRRVSAASVAEALGLKPEPPPEPPMADSPHAARLRSEGKVKEADEVMEAAKQSFIVRTIPAGREIHDMWGAPELPIGAEEGMSPPEPNRKGGPPSVVNAPSPEESAAELRHEARELAREADRHAERSMERAVDARTFSGSPATVKQADADVTAAFSARDMVKKVFGI